MKIELGTYNFWKDEHSLIRPVENPLDEKIGLLSRIYAESDEALRSKIRIAISNDFNSLLIFGKRKAVFALKAQTEEHLIDGLTAVAMIENNSLDDREVHAVLAHLYYAALRINHNPKSLFEGATATASPSVSRVVSQVLKTYAPRHANGRGFGLYEVQTEAGLGLINRQSEFYEPTYDLPGISIAVSDLLSKDKYQPSRIAIETEGVPKFWLSSRDDEMLEKVLQSVRAGAQIHAKLRSRNEDQHLGEGGQFLMVFLAEMNDDNSAQVLRNYSLSRKIPGTGLFGVAYDKLFILFVQRAEEGGIEAYETRTSLGRFASDILGLLRDKLGSGLS